MTKELAPVRGVSNQYGARTTGRAIGHLVTDGVFNELTVDVTGQSLSDGIFGQVFIPAGSLVQSAFVEVTEAFVFGGTTPEIAFGTKGSEVTNGVSVTEAEAEAVSTVDITASIQGTWTSALVATEVDVALGGTTPTVDTSVGKARIVVRYIHL